MHREEPARAAATDPHPVRAGDDAMYEQHLHHSQVLQRMVSGCPFCPRAMATATSEAFGSPEAGHVR